MSSNNGNHGNGNGQRKWLKSKQSRRGGVRRSNRKHQPRKRNGKPVPAT